MIQLSQLNIHLLLWCMCYRPLSELGYVSRHILRTERGYSLRLWETVSCIERYPVIRKKTCKTRRPLKPCFLKPLETLETSLDSFLPYQTTAVWMPSPWCLFIYFGTKSSYSINFVTSFMIHHKNWSEGIKSITEMPWRIQKTNNITFKCTDIRF